MNGLANVPGLSPLNQSPLDFNNLQRKFSEMPVKGIGEEKLANIENKSTEQIQNASYRTASVHLELSMEFSAATLVNNVYQSVSKKLDLSLDVSVTEIFAGENAKKLADFSPQEAAKQIMEHVQKRFGDFLANNPQNIGENKPEKPVDSFMQKVMSGIDTGFAQAKQALSNFNQKNSELENKFNDTYNLINKGFEGLRNKLLEEIRTIQAEQVLKMKEIADSAKVENPITLGDLL